MTLALGAMNTCVAGVSAQTVEQTVGTPGPSVGVTRPDDSRTTANVGRGGMRERDSAVGILTTMTGQPHLSRRWFDLQMAAIGLRYRTLINSEGVVTASDIQSTQAFLGRFKLDAQGAYSWHAAVFSGDRFSSRWNDTGIGTGDPAYEVFLKELFFAARPFRGLELQVGGLYIARGESSEATSYDNDGYLVGERVSLTRVSTFLFDEIDVTRAYLGDLTRPNVIPRYRRLGEANYYQVLASKKLRKRVAVSADFTRLSTTDTLRAALSLHTPELVMADHLRFESYARLDPSPAYGFAVAAEKRLSTRLMVGAGFSDIDRHYGGLNGDQHAVGRRVFAWGGLMVGPGFAVSAHFTQAVGDNSLGGTRTRFDLGVAYDVLTALRRAN